MAAFRSVMTGVSGFSLICQFPVSRIWMDLWTPSLRGASQLGVRGRSALFLSDRDLVMSKEPGPWQHPVAGSCPRRYTKLLLSVSLQCVRIGITNHEQHGDGTGATADGGDFDTRRPEE